MVQSSFTCPITPGEVLMGKYRVERVLGMGGMGVVVAARHIDLDEQVAIKFLLPQALGNPEAVNRFAREARSAVKIKSQHVARTLDVGRLENGAPYIVMEYLDGTDLATRLRQQGPLSIEEAVTFTLQVCEALADAHAVGVIHRDLKPANLFVTRATDGTECIKVLDFGISKFTDASGSAPSLVVTNTAALMGSPLYMAPEQMASARTVDARCDIWSLGITLYELLTGVHPFVAVNIAELATMVTQSPTPSVCERRPDVPVGLEGIINRCLAKDCQQRYLNVAELALALVDFAPRRSRYSAEHASRVLAAAGLSASAIQLPPSTDPSAKTVTSGDSAIPSAWGNTKPPPHRRVGVIIAAALGVLTVGVSAVVLLKGAPTTIAPAGSSSSFVGEPSRAVGVAVAPSAAPKASDLEVTPIVSAGSDPGPAAKPSANSKVRPQSQQDRPRMDKSPTPTALRSPSKITPKSPADPVTSSRLPNLGGVGREF